MTKQLKISDIVTSISTTAANVQQNTTSAALVDLALHQPEVSQASSGALVATTGSITGRSAKDKYIVEDPMTVDTVWWDNTKKMTGDNFDILLFDMLESINGKDIFRQQLQAGADSANTYDVEVFSPSAWHALFIQNLLIEPDLTDFAADVCVLHLPDFEADPTRHGCNSKTCIALDFTRKIVLICGTSYAGEIKKSVFSLFNFDAPARGVLPMHCSANVGKDGDAALFFGLSGTGKTTLSSSPDRALVGDDEHGWSKDGIFNLEGGCYAKAIDLTFEAEPEIFTAAKYPGAVLENVVLDKTTGEPDYTDISLTENTRISYPLAAIPNRVPSGVASTPKNVVLLTADAFGVLPPIARLTREQAIYYFLSGYTAKVAGTETGVTEPQATFSACFGAPFMSRFPTDYGDLLDTRLQESGAQCWLLNTGWTGGAYGVGKRMALKDTRRMLDAALSGELNTVEFHQDSVFGLEIPSAIDGIDAKILDPVQTWSDSHAYKKQAEMLVQLFIENYSKVSSNASEDTKTTLPRLTA